MTYNPERLYTSNLTRIQHNIIENSKRISYRERVWYKSRSDIIVLISQSSTSKVVGTYLYTTYNIRKLKA